MTAIELLQTLKQKGVRLQPCGERLRYFPSSAVTPELKEALAVHKAEIIGILQQPAAEPLHFALKDQAVLGQPIIEKCLVEGCDEKIKFLLLRWSWIWLLPPLRHSSASHYKNDVT